MITYMVCRESVCGKYVGSRFEGRLDDYFGCVQRKSTCLDYPWCVAGECVRKVSWKTVAIGCAIIERLHQLSARMQHFGRWNAMWPPGHHHFGLRITELSSNRPNPLLPPSYAMQTCSPSYFRANLPWESLRVARAMTG